MKHISLLLSFVLFFTAAISQTPESLLEKVQKNYTTEKIYLQYDKSFYMAGETAWFKAYLMQGYFPASGSTVLAVELINDSGKVIDKKILPVNGSTAIGEFSFPNTLPQGNYIVKAFTRNLMNFGFESFYYHPLYIYNPATISVASEKNPATRIHFFPEGGNLVCSIKNTIAFKCTNDRGIPENITGNVLDGGGKLQASFKSSHDGMGTFFLTPLPGERYTVECMVRGEKQPVQQLPAALREGTMLNIIRQENKTYFSLDATTVANETFVPDYILGVQENMVAFKVSVPATAKRFKGEIPIAQLPSGILQLTVFNKNNKPLAERLVFINTGDYIPSCDFQKAKVDFTRRGRNIFSLNVADTMAGSYAVSVTEADDEISADDNIISRLLLTTDIKGIVYRPAYYFESLDELHREQLDLVMLTHGWRRYSWNELFLNRFPTMAFKDPDFISLEATATDPVTGRPLANSALTVLTKTRDDKTNFSSIETDSAGNFLLAGMMFEDTALFIVQSNLTKNSKVNIRLSSQNIGSTFYSLKTATPALSFNAPGEKLMEKFKAGYSANTLSKFDGILLDEVKIKAKLKSQREQYEKKYISGRMGTATKTIDFLSEPTTSSQNIFSYLQSRLNGVNITGGPLDYSIVYRNARSLIGGPIQMGIFLDEFEVSASQIATMKITDVAMIKLYSSGGLSGGPGGAIAIYTKKGGGNASQDFSHKQIFVEGFSPTKEFFSPDYAVNAGTDVLSDNRTTLYWNPYLQTNAQNKSINFSFYNSDKAKRFKIVLEGMLENGKLLHFEKIIE